VYKHINAGLTHKAGIAPLIDNSGGLVVNDLAKANLLNSHFVNICKIDNGVIPIFGRVTTKCISSVNFSTHDVCVAIDDLSATSSPGPDGLPSVFFKSLASQLLFPLSVFSVIFNRIIKNSNIPDDWKIPTNKPIFEKGFSSDPNNYRPISQTSVVCKLFEAIR